MDLPTLDSVETGCGMSHRQGHGTQVLGERRRNRRRLLAVLDTASARAPYCHGAMPYLSLRRRASRTSRNDNRRPGRSRFVQFRQPSTTSYSSPNYRTAARAWRLLRRVDERPSGSRRALLPMPDRCAQVRSRCANLAKRACRAGGDVRLGRIAALRAR